MLNVCSTTDSHTASDYTSSTSTWGYSSLLVLFASS